MKHNYIGVLLWQYKNGQSVYFVLGWSLPFSTDSNALTLRYLRDRKHRTILTRLAGLAQSSSDFLDKQFNRHLRV